VSKLIKKRIERNKFLTHSLCDLMQVKRLLKL
jgi:hypothetical protein